MREFHLEMNLTKSVMIYMFLCQQVLVKVRKTYHYEEPIDLRREFELFISKLQASSVPLSVTQNVVKEIEELILGVLKYIEN